MDSVQLTEKNNAMAISREAISYLNHLQEKYPDWTLMPDDDPIIVKLHLLFEVKKSRSGKRKMWNKLKMTHKGHARIFNSLDECCEIMNLNKNSLKTAISLNREFKGMIFERIYEDE